MTLMLLDSASLWYRAYYGMPDTLVSPEGEPTNAIRGFIDMTARLIDMYNPNRIVACIEGDWRPTWRTDLFPNYKANRLDDEGDEEEPDLLSPQIPILLHLLDAFRIPIVGVDDYEADDVMATYALRERGPIRVVTGDRDLFQLVDDKKDIAIVYLAKGLSNHDLVRRQYIESKYAIPGDRYALFAMIRGDASDGLPGIRGIGEKGAAAIANIFTSMEDVISAAQDESDARLTPAHRKKLLADIEYARIAPKLVHCALDVSVPDIDLAIPQAPESLDEIYKISQRYGLGSPVDRLIASLNW